MCSFTSAVDETVGGARVRQHLAEGEHRVQHVVVVRLAVAQRGHQRAAAARRRQRRGRALVRAQRARRHHRLEYQRRRALVRCNFMFKLI